MSRSREADNEEPLFQFDSYESPVGAATPVEPSSTRPTSSRVNLSISQFSLSTPNLLAYRSDQTTLLEMTEQILSGADKGKGPSQPVLIRASTTQLSHDTFDVGSSSSGYFSMEGMSYSPSSPLASSSFDLQAIQTPLDDIYYRLTIAGYSDPVAPGSCEAPADAAGGSASGKGKARELAPMLPPLQFTPTEFGYDKAAWPSPGLISPGAGPSSYGSALGSMGVESTLNANMAARAAVPSQSPPAVRRMPSRRHSFSNLSTRSMRGALSPLKTTGNLARRLMQRGKSGTSPSTPGTATPRNVAAIDYEVGQGSCLTPWRSGPGKDTPPVPFLAWDAQLNDKLPVYNGKEFKGKGRSYSSPYPLSALDIIPVATTDVFKPIIIAPRKFFDEMLPRELRLRVLSSLISLHEEEHGRMVLAKEWSVTRASSSRYKFVGKEKAVRELVKFSRVSRAWQALVLDGQLWRHIDLRSFPKLPSSLLCRLSKVAGPFVQSLDLSGHTSLLPSTLTDIIKDFCVDTSSFSPYTQLTKINFQGCSALTTRSLHEVLLASPSLEVILLKGLTAVTNTTCDVIGETCPQLTTLNISRCANVDGWGIRSLVTSGVVHRGHLLLKSLKASGLRRINDRTLLALGKSAPFLEVLDLSYVYDLHNSALEAFVACTPDENVLGETVVLTSRQAGRDPIDSTRYRRRVTQLRHLSLSSCHLLTDNACANLAHTMPRLELLELAGIGAELRDEGLVRLLETTPLIRKLDLEDASSISDKDLKVGRDECDPERVVLKSFYSWQTVDAVQAARDKRRKTRRVVNVSNGSTSDFEETVFATSGRTRWWPQSSRRSSGTTSPEARLEMGNDRDQCTIM
ncbi:hypothetical protein HWV62_18696 [Athelia sp. TMB]|nr:hypothetical protein HWV62_18696 [Athelia sp. TMB]